MRAAHAVKLVAIAGGSGAGKTWLADRLHRLSGGETGRISLDDFYYDRSHLSASRRAAINFDDPEAIDWPLFERVLRDCRAGRPVFLPRYDFHSHRRLEEREKCDLQPVVLVDGLWLLQRPGVCGMFDLKIFIECSERLRIQRRIARDVVERGRTAAFSERQFKATVAPMHQRYVAPQINWTNLILYSPCTDADVRSVYTVIESLMGKQPVSAGANSNHGANTESTETEKMEIRL